MVTGFAHFPKNDKGFSIVVYKELSTKEVSHYNKMINEISLLWKREELFFTVNVNYDDILSRVYDLPDPFKNIKLSFEEVSELCVFQFGRFLSNFLSSYRMYLDHLQGQICHEFGKESEQLKIFKEACATEYDACFEYRFFDKIRNYFQHCGNPVNVASLTSSLDIDNGKTGKYTFAIDAKKLSTSFDWKASLKMEIDQRQWPLDLGSALPEYINCLQRIHLKVGRIYRESYFNILSYFDNILANRRDKNLEVFFFDCENVEQLKYGGKFTGNPLPMLKINFLRMITSNDDICIRRENQ